MKMFFLFTIGLYRRYLSPFLPSVCRFTPTCSEYAHDAFMHENTVRAIWMTLVRISKCHPFHPGGYDPVRKEEVHDRKDISSPLPASACCGQKKP
jgi:putative membrane protein insertion efficiency factor